MLQLGKKSKKQSNHRAFPSLPESGTYALLFLLKKSVKIRVGSFNKLFFKKGSYVYVGSARRGLRARVGRHLARDKKVRWHIDWITSCRYFELSEVWVSDVIGVECRLAAAIGEEADGAVLGFGSSDCRCKSHLFYFSHNRAGKILSKLGLSHAV